MGVEGTKSRHFASGSVLMRVLKNYLYNIVYQVFVLLLPFITVPYISRVLEASGVGINAYTSSIMQYFILFASLGINTYGNREIAYYQHDKEKVSQIFWEIYLLRLLLVGLVYVIFLVFLTVVDQYQKYYFYQSFALLAVAFDISWLFMGLEDFKKTVLRNTVVKAISLVLIFTCVKTASDLGIYILILSLSTFFGNLTFFSYLSRTVYPLKQVGKVQPFKHLKASFIMFIPQFSVSLYIVLNKTILGFFKGATDVGYFENADKLIAMVIAVLTATKTVLMPRVAHLHSQGQHDQTKALVYQFFTLLNILALPATVGLMIIAPKFSLWFFGDEFWRTGIALIFYAPSLIFNAWNTVFGQQYLLPLNRMKEYNQSIFYAAMMTVILDLLVAEPFGLYGIAFVSTISEVLVAGIQLYYLRRDIQFKRLFNDYGKMMASALIMGGFIFIYNDYVEMNMLTLVVEVLVGMMVYGVMLWVFKVKMIDSIVETIKKRRRNV